MRDAIRLHALELGFDACRITTAVQPESATLLQRWLASGRHGEMDYMRRTVERRVNPQVVLPGARSIITLLASYGIAREAEKLDQARSAGEHLGIVARYARFEDYHSVLEQPLKRLVEFIQNVGGGQAECLSYTDTGPILERDLAQRAGSGFIGKHTNLISRDFGNWTLLSEILTTLELEPDPPEVNRCGSCTRCISACPTRAIVAPFQLDARRCISYLTIELKGSIPIEFRESIGNRIFGCDDCLAICPWNRFAREGALMRNHVRPEFATLDLLDLLSLDEVGFKSRFAGTPLVRCKRRGLLRNVCVALGNVGDAFALGRLEKTARESEPLVAEHAHWAIRAIERRLNSGPILPSRTDATGDD